MYQHAMEQLVRLFAQFSTGWMHRKRYKLGKKAYTYIYYKSNYGGTYNLN